MRVAYQYTSHVFPFRCARVKTLSFSPFVHVFSHYKKILIKLYLFLNSSLSLSLSLSAKLFGRYYNLVLYRVSSSSSSSSSMLLRRLRRWFYLCTPRMRRKRIRRKRVPIAVSAMLLRVPFQQKHHHKRTKR